MRIALPFLAILISVTGLRAQTFSVSGAVKDSVTSRPLIGATVVLSRNDSNLQGVIVGSEGVYRFEQLPAGTYKLEYSLIGYHSTSRSLNLKEDVVLGDVFIGQDARSLEGVEVRERYRLGETKGDTSEFNARAFKTTQNASAKDLVGKVPGVSTDGGDVKAEGESVQQVLVDGKPFFGQDINTALGVLPAEVVDKIQVFDDQSEQSKASGVDDGTRVKTINIVTRINMRNGEFGKVYAGYGTDDRYNAGGNINMFRGDMRMTFLGQANNINIQNFSTSDLLGVVADNSGRGHRRGPAFMRGFSVGSDASDFMVNPQNGVVETMAGGLNYQDSWSDKMEVSSSYFYNRSLNTSITNTNQQFFFEGTEGQTYQEDDVSESVNSNHRFNAKMTYKLDDMTSFYMLPAFSAQVNEGDQTTLGISSIQGQVQSALDNLFSSDLSAINWSNDLMFRKRFEKEGRSLFARYRVGQQTSNGNNRLTIYDVMVMPEVLHRDQEAELETRGLDHSLGLMYSEPIGEKGLNTFFTYDLDNSNTSTDNYTFELDPFERRLDSLLSNSNTNDWMNHTFGAGIRKFNRQFGFVARMKYEVASLNNDQMVPMSTTVTRDYRNFLPFGLIRWQVTKNSNIFMMYRSYTTAPSADQLQEYIDNSNPIQLSKGNEELEQQYSHYLRLRFKSNSKDNESVFYAGIRARMSNSYIGTETLTATEDLIVDGYPLNAGQQISHPVNLSGFYSLNSMVNYGFAVGAIKSNLNFDLSNTIARTPSIINSIQLFSHSSLSSFGVVLSSNISERVDFTVSSNSAYNSVTNDLNPALDNAYFIQVGKVKFDWVMPLGFTFRTQFEYQEYFGLDAGFDNNVMLWNASIGKQLFPNKRGEVQLTVFDILEQNNQISQQFLSGYYEESRSNVLTQYVMLSFSYNIRRFGAGSKGMPSAPEERHHH